MTAMRTGSRRHRIVLAVIASTACVAALAGGGSAARLDSPTGEQQAEKATVCHKGKKTIRISVNAVPAHLRHGDTEGLCNAAATAPGKPAEGKPAKTKPAKSKPAKNKPAKS